MRGMILGIVVAGVLATKGLAGESTCVTNAQDLTEMSIEDLMRVKVFSVAKNLQPWFESPAAVYVITGDDIRRSGATSIPEALRLAPGLDVARVNVHAWAIGSRGFNSLFSDKLLVLMDGRSVYTPMFSGVWWNSQDTLLEDIDRIEVVRGVDGTVWGANAVNGVINIITKSAKDTQGLLLTGGGGNEERGFGAARYGLKLDEQTWFRVYAKGFNRVEDYEALGLTGKFDWQQERGGFRLDHDGGDNRFTIQGDLFNDQNLGFGVYPDLSSPTFVLVDTTSPFRTWGGNLLGRWTHRCANDAEWTLQTYYDYESHYFQYSLDEKRHTGDVDFQYRFALGDRQFLTCGAGYRVAADHFGPTLGTSFVPASRTLNLFSVFVQDEIVLAPDRLRLTLGAKLEHNDYTGCEVQPSARLAWTPTRQQTVWAAVSRAVRIPARDDRDMLFNIGVIPGATNTLLQIQGTPGFESEKVVGFELGYRVQPLEQLLFDATTFYNLYEDLRGVRPGTPYFDAGRYVQPLFYENLLTGQTYGFEIAADWRPVHWWRVQASYTFLRMQEQESIPGVYSYTAEGDSPRNQVALRTSLDLPWHIELDGGVRYVDVLSTLRVPSYWAANLRLGWRPNKNWEVAVVGQQLLDSQHPEFAQNFVVAPSEVQHSIYAQVTWRY